jgi:hypothetical protein
MLNFQQVLFKQQQQLFKIIELLAIFLNLFSYIGLGSGQIGPDQPMLFLRNTGKNLFKSTSSFTWH